METRPSEITRAVYLFISSLVIGLVKTVIDWDQITANGSPATTVYILFFTITLTGFLVWRVAEGAHWARITLLMFSLLGLLPFYAVVRWEFAHSPIVGVSSVSQFLLQAVALYALFSYPGSEWFRRDSASSPLTKDTMT